MSAMTWRVEARKGVAGSWGVYSEYHCRADALAVAETHRPPLGWQFRLVDAATGSVVHLDHDGKEVSSESSAAAGHDERAVRMALAAGTANLRLKRVREVLDQCTPEDRRRILSALDGPVEVV